MNQQGGRPVGSLDSETVYSVELVGDQYEVHRNTGRVILSCRDEGSAQHYAVLLNQAFDAGFKAGFRAARSRT